MTKPFRNIIVFLPNLYLFPDIAFNGLKDEINNAGYSPERTPNRYINPIPINKYSAGRANRSNCISTKSLKKGINNCINVKDKIIEKLISNKASNRN